MPDSRVQWQRVTVTGTYLPEAEMVARLWAVQGKSRSRSAPAARPGTRRGATLLL